MENISQMSLLEVALNIMNEKGGVVNVYDLVAEVLKLKGLEDADGALAAQLYVDITTSSKFVYMGDDNWDLKSRQSLDQFDKDGASFNPKGEVDIPDDEEEEEPLTEDDIDEEDEENEDDEDEESDSESEDDEESDSDSNDMYEPEEDEEDEESDSESDEDEDSDNGIDEDKYNEYMDDYEDLYES